MAATSFIPLLTQLYGAEIAAQVEPRIQSRMDLYRGRIAVLEDASLSERDSVLITYADQVRQAGQPHLQTLADFCETHLHGVIRGIHLLPFFPWSSDDGFSVMDYRTVEPSLGDWSDLERLSRSFRLMFDCVLNHASAQGEWFRAFLRNEEPYCHYFLTVEGHPDLSGVVRPRALPLLTKYQTATGPRQVWTTFSADQVDLDYHNPDVLLETLDILLMYVARGAQLLRLDAISYLWKEIGTTCINLPQTHAFIQLLRAVLDDVAPHVGILTETNIPHAENLSYFGDGTNETQMVYNFALPPLVLHTFRTGDATVLTQWASGWDLPSEKATFFNFLASHDGIGLNPVRGILSTAEIEGLMEQTQAHGGLISYKQNPDGTRSPYEMNINYFDALSNPSAGEPIELQVDRFIAAQAIMLSLRGVPGVYFHSLFGSRNWADGVRLTNHNRAINRQKLERAGLEAELAKVNSLRAQVFGRYRQLLVQRAASPAFHPNGGQTVLDMGPSIFAVLRTSRNGAERVLCIQNVTAQPRTVGAFQLKPYQTLWVNHPETA